MPRRAPLPLTSHASSPKPAVEEEQAGGIAWTLQRARLYTSRYCARAGETGAGTLSEWVVALCLRGHWTHYYPGGSIEAVAGDAMMIWPNVVQRWQVGDVAGADGVAAESVYAVLKPPAHWLSRLELPETTPGYSLVHLTDPTCFREAKRSLLRAHRLTQSGHVNRFDLALNAIESFLLWCHEALRRQSAPYDSRIARAIDYIAAHLAEPIELDQLARAAHLSRSQFALLFRQQVGCTPMQLVEQERIARARQVLEITDWPIHEVAHAVGFDEPRYFGVRFKRETGMTPREFRRQRRDDSPAARRAIHED